MQNDDGEVLGRSARKHGAIIEAARTVFLRNGYRGTSMDEIAALAKVSKQTVYKHFADKERLFSEVIELTMSGTKESIQEEAELLATSNDLAAGLELFARALLWSLGHAEVLRLRRLVIGEAERFPALGKAYWDQAFNQGVQRLAAALEALTARGLLNVDDPSLAAAQFAGMVLWIPANRVMFRGGEPTPEEVDRYAVGAARQFLRAYRPPVRPARP